MQKPWGHYCVTADGKKFTITEIALKAMSAKEKSAWDKANTILFPIDPEGRRIKTDDEIGTEKANREAEMKAKAEFEAAEKAEKEADGKAKKGKTKSE